MELNLDVKQMVPHRREGQLKHTLDTYGKIKQPFDQDKGAGPQGSQVQIPAHFL